MFALAVSDERIRRIFVEFFCAASLVPASFNGNTSQNFCPATLRTEHLEAESTSLTKMR